MHLARGQLIDDKLFREFEANLKEAMNLAKGSSTPVYVVVTPAEIKRSRAGVKMSQTVFAHTFQLSVEIVKGVGAKQAQARCRSRKLSADDLGRFGVPAAHPRSVINVNSLVGMPG